MSHRPLLFALALAALLLLPASSGASQFRTFGGYEVHYNALRADFVPPEVAIRNGITRSAARGLVIIAVRDMRGGGLGVPAEAEITLTAENLAGQSQAVRMKATREADAIHYLGEFRLAGSDTWRFEAEVRPGDDERSYRLRWAQPLVAEGR
jgi:hypothetical protein